MVVSSANILTLPEGQHVDNKQKTKTNKNFIDQDYNINWLQTVLFTVRIALKGYQL